MKKAEFHPQRSTELTTEIERFKKKFDSSPTTAYALYFPTDGYSPGVMYSPQGVFQIFDFIVAYGGKLMYGDFEGDVLDADGIRALTQKEDHYLEILLNLKNKHNDALVECDDWLWSIAEETEKELYIFFRCIANISTGQIANLMFYDDAPKNKLLHGCIKDEKYRLLKKLLLYGTGKAHEDD